MRSGSNYFVPWILLAAGAAVVAMALRKRRRIDFHGKSVVISGGSRGLGLELARQLAAEGARLSLLARNAEELARAGGELQSLGADVLTFTCDIRNRTEVDTTVATILERRGRIDVLMNVAGIVQVAPFENLDWLDYKESMDVHAWGPLHMIRAVAPHMQERRAGRIVNISSIGGLVAIPHLLAYSMGKFALTGLSDGLRAELAKDGIQVTTVAPGLMRTGSHFNALFRGQHRKEFAWFALSAGNPLFSTSSRRAARQIIEACRYGDPRLIITLPARLLHLANAVLPRSTAAGTSLAARLLPSPAVATEMPLQTGWDSRSWMAPSILTRLSDRATSRNNEKRP